jgi:hypothetical protein
MGRSAFLLMLLAQLTGCTAGGINGTSQKKGEQKTTEEGEKKEVIEKEGEETPFKDGPENTVPTEDAEEIEESEDNISDLPVEVTGAFITKTESSGFENVVASAGFRLIGINVYERYSSLKVEDPVRIIELSFLAKGVIQKFRPLKTPTVSRNIVHAIFEIPVEFEHPFVDLSVKVSVSESANFDLGANEIFSDDGTDSGLNTPIIGKPNTSPKPLENVSSHILFVTSNLYRPGLDFTSTKTANRLCNLESNDKPTLAGFWWTAILSDNEWLLAERIRIHGPIQNTTGSALLPAVELLTGISLPENLLLAADGTSVSTFPSDLVYTGTDASGGIGETCNSWKSSTGKASAGLAGSASNWLYTTVVDCNVPRRLYCINSKIR